MILNQSVQIKKAVPTDASEIAALERVCFSRPWAESSVLSEIENPNVCFLVCFFDGVLCGYISARFTCGEWYVSNLAVLSAYRRQGIGKLLLTSLIKSAKEQNAFFVSLEVRRSNENAIRLYESCGFLLSGNRKNFYSFPQEDAAIYTLYLNEGEINL